MHHSPLTTHYSLLTTHMRILVTGGAGYIGSHLVRVFSARGHEVWVYDNLSMGPRQAVPAERLIVGDLDELPKLEHALLVHQIEAVVHFAAFAYVGEPVKDPGKYYKNNLVNTLNLMECLRRCGVSRLVFSSTCATYGVPGQVPNPDPGRHLHPRLHSRRRSGRGALARPGKVETGRWPTLQPRHRSRV